MSNLKSLISDVVASPLGQVIAQVGQGVADAQEALDDASLRKVLEIYSEGDDEALKLLRDIGYKPTFYTLPDTTGEVRVALRLGNGAQGAGPSVRAVKPQTGTVNAVPARVGLSARAAKMYVSPVDAGYANSYGYQADISAKLTFRIVPVPPPDGADEIRRVPTLVGLSVSDVADALAPLGVEAQYLDADGLVVADPAASAVVTAQSPEADETIRVDEVINLTI